MKKSKFILRIVFLFFLSTKSFPQAGTLDLSYASNGRVLTSYSPARFIPVSSVIQENGFIVLMGRYGFPSSGVSQIGLSRHITDGTIDTSFGTNGFLSININNNTYGESITLQQDGKIVVAGYILTSGTSSSLLVIRLNSDGSFDTSFGNNGIALFDNNIKAYSVKMKTDNKIVIGGNNGDSDFTVVRLNSDGSLDNSFGFNGVVSTTIVNSSYESRINAVNIQNDGKIVASGFAFMNFVHVNFCTVRYNTNGSIDNTFGVNGKVLTNVDSTNSSVIYAQAIQQDGKIVVTGSSEGASVLARYNSNGTLDSSFGINGMSIFTFGDSCISRSVLIQPDNKIVIVGESFLPVDKYMIARYTTNGEFDTTFNTTGYNLGNFSTNNNYFNSVLMQPDGKLTATGWNQIGNDPYTVIARFNSGLNLSNYEFEKDSFVVYPNPSSGVFQLTFNKSFSQKMVYSIYDVMGRKIIEKEISNESSSFDINLENYPKGIYLLNVTTGETKVVKKLVVK